MEERKVPIEIIYDDVKNEIGLERLIIISAGTLSFATIGCLISILISRKIYK
jgi:hypothetical protein